MALLASIWSRFTPSQVVGAFRQLGWSGIPLIGLSCVWLPFDCWAFARMLRPGSFGPRLLLLEWAADGLSGLLPVGGFGGDPFRFRHVRGLTDAPGRVVVANRLLHAWSGLLAAVTAGLSCWLLRLPDPGWTAQVPNASWARLAALGGVVFVAGAALMLWVARRRWPQMPLSRLLLAGAAKLASRAVQASEVWVILSLLGYRPGASGALLVHAHLLAAASLFVFVPGGLGVQEKALELGAVAAGLPAVAGLQLGLLRRLRQVLWSLAGLGAGAYLEASLRSSQLSKEE